MDAAIAALLQASVLPVAPPAPPMMVTSPPIVRSVPIQRRLSRATIDVEIRAGGDLLWSGPLTVSSLQGASFMRRSTEAAADDCPDAGYNQSADNMLNVQLGSTRQIDGDGAVSVSVRWTRSIPGTCPLRGGSRTVEVNDTVLLPPGRSVSLAGDGALSIRLRRR